MGAVTLFFWSREFNNSFNYGTHIHLNEDRSVFFANRLMPPGRIIHQWHSNGDPISLPLLIPGRSYHFSLAGITAPDKMFTQVVYLDETDQIVDQQEFPDHQGTLAMPAGAVNYRLQLMNIRQTGTEFQYGLVMPQSLAVESTVSVALQAGMIRIQVKDAAAAAQQNLVVLANRFAAISVPVQAGQSTVAVFKTPDQAQIDQVQAALQPDVPVQLQVVGQGLAGWAEQLRTALAPNFSFLDSEGKE